MKNLVSLACGYSNTLGLTLVYKVSKFSDVLDLIEILKQNNEYLRDDIIDKYHHSITVNVPINIGAFIKGDYTEIYNRNDLFKIVKKDTPAFKIMSGDRSYLPEFYSYMKETFNVSSDVLSEYTQMDIPPNLNLEILFYDINRLSNTSQKNMS